MEKNIVTIFVMAYNNVPTIKLPNCYKIVDCGHSYHKYFQSINIIYDDILDNISNENKYYSELTGLYWTWKNDNSSIKGLVCYRRFLVKLFPYFHILKENEIKKVLKKYDIILSKKKYLGGATVRKQFELGVSNENIVLLEKIIKKMYPEYIESMNYIWKQKKLSAFNIMISTKKLYDEYCEWLFSILFEMEKFVDYSTVNGYKVRIFAFISERLLPVWVDHKKLKVKYFRKYNTEWKKFLKLKLQKKTEK